MRKAIHNRNAGCCRIGSDGDVIWEPPEVTVHNRRYGERSEIDTRQGIDILPIENVERRNVGVGNMIPEIIARVNNIRIRARNVDAKVVVSVAAKDIPACAAVSATAEVDRNANNANARAAVVFDSVLFDWPAESLNCSDIPRTRRQ
jgi:hypothetical protein